MRATIKDTPIPENAFVFNPGTIQLAEFDLGGVLYHANYFRLFERAREALLEAIGHPYSRLVNDGFHLAVVHSEQFFLRPISYGSEAQIQVWITDIAKASITFAYEICCKTNESTESCHRAVTKHAFVKVDQNTFRIKPLTQSLSSALTPFIGKTSTVS